MAELDFTIILAYAKSHPGRIGRGIIRLNGGNRICRVRLNDVRRGWVRCDGVQILVTSLPRRFQAIHLYHFNYPFIPCLSSSLSHKRNVRAVTSKINGVTFLTLWRNSASISALFRIYVASKTKFQRNCVALAGYKTAQILDSLLIIWSIQFNVFAIEKGSNSLSDEIKISDKTP